MVSVMRNGTKPFGPGLGMSVMRYGTPEGD